MNNSSIIKTKGLSYHYSKDVQTLFDIDLDVERGSIYGFLGPNGSGKTTTLSLLLGLLNNQKGDIEIFGEHLHANRINILKKIGSLIETPSLYGHLTAKKNLEVYREVYGASKARIAEVLNIVGLEDTGKKTVKKFSLGMKQRLAIALALLPTPELLWRLIRMISKSLQNTDRSQRCIFSKLLNSRPAESQAEHRQLRHKD